MPFSLLYDQTASNLGARVRFSTSQTWISIQTTTRQPHHSEARCALAQLVLPDHSELDTGTLRFVLRQAFGALPWRWPMAS